MRLRHCGICQLSGSHGALRYITREDAESVEHRHEHQAAAWLCLRPAIARNVEGAIIKTAKRGETLRLGLWGKRAVNKPGVIRDLASRDFCSGKKLDHKKQDRK